MSFETSSAVPVPRLKLLAERPADDPMPLMAPAAPLSPPSSASYPSQMLATLQAIAMVLSARILLLIAVLAAFALSLTTIFDPTNLKVIATSAFHVCVVIPLVGLYAMKG